MRFYRRGIVLCAAALATLMPALAGQADAPAERPSAVTQETIDQLRNQLVAVEARVKELEEKLARQNPGAQNPGAVVAPQTPGEAPVARAAATPIIEAPPNPGAQETHDPHDHMDLPGGGPALKFRGFFDFNFGIGRDANPLIFPLNAPAHNTFQSGEFDLFMTSKLSDRISFIGEIVIGSDPTNEWGIDIERLQLTYKASRYFEISGGRYHTSIGYYNTAFHHGTWFQTATGRPFMYFFEDSGGILPVHSVGVTTTGLVPGTDKLGLHWVAEVGNGRSSSRWASPVQNFLSDKNHKNFNLAAYIAPEWLPGLQVGGSYYRDRMVPPGLSPVEQHIESLYAVYITPRWESLTEGVLLSNRTDGQSKVYRTPLAYTQLSRKFDNFRPYFRYQYVNSPSNDPVNIYTGRYKGPSVGVRMDFTNYAAFKIQYNRLEQLNVAPLNGVDFQLAFTF
jgi:hypothetical protein